MQPSINIIDRGYYYYYKINIATIVIQFFNIKKDSERVRKTIINTYSNLWFLSRLVSSLS